MTVIGGPSAPRFARLLALMPLLALIPLLAAASPAAAQDFGRPQPPQHVYDRTGLLTPEEISMLEARAAEVEAAGAPVIVYLQPEDADFDETAEDGLELMEEWDVQSARDVRDGVVVFLNLEPDDPRHGELAVVAGEAHADGGNLPEYELERITSEMRSILGDEETAAGIARGLEMIATSLATDPAPPPEPSTAEKVAADLSRGIVSPVNVVGLVMAAATLFLVVMAPRPRAATTTRASAVPVTTPPGDLMPAAAGALVDGRINDLEVEATVLDLARRGALAIEPAGDGGDASEKVQIRLLDGGVAANDFERKVWDALETAAGSDGLIPNDELAKLRSHWKPARESLRAGLEQRGWFDPAAGRRRRPLFAMGTIALVLFFVAFIISMAGEQLWGLLGAGVLLVAGIVGLVAGYQLRSTTLEGERQAGPWRAYLEGLKSASKNTQAAIDLDRAVPYAVAMNARHKLDKRLKEASEQGYTPAWLGTTVAPDVWAAGGFYPYFVAFHSSVAPSAGTGAGAGAAAGAAAAGGGF